MVGLKSCSRSQEILFKTNIESLPDEVLFEILIFLPAQDIYDSARFVCCKWHRMINTPAFVDARLLRTPPGLLFLRGYWDEGSLLMSVRKNGQTEMSMLRHKFCSRFCVSANGLILDFDLDELRFKQRFTLYIVNPVTKQHVVLPHIDRLHFGSHGIAYASASMQYKVVVARSTLNTLTEDCCFIFTVGVDDSWRSVDCARFSYETRELFYSTPLVTSGFLHWCGGGPRGNEVFTLDVETEVIKETPPPIPQVYNNYQWTYLSTGRYLSLLLRLEFYLWQVWEMEPETGEWRNVSSISLDAHKRTFEHIPCGHTEHITPISWLVYPEVLVYGFSCGCNNFIFPYNLLTREIDTIALPSPLSSYGWLFHKNSLVRF